MKAIVFSVGLLFSASLVYSENLKVFYGPTLVSNVSFDSVTYEYTDHTEYPYNVNDYPDGAIIFKAVKLEVEENDPVWGRIWWNVHNLDITAPVDSVKILLAKDAKKYISLDIMNIYSGLVEPIAEAKKVTVRVASEADFNSWTKFLVAVKKKNELYRIEHGEPGNKRVLPPRVK